MIKKLFVLFLLIFAFILSSCATQADIDKAYSEGYKAGYNEGEKLSQPAYESDNDVVIITGKENAVVRDSSSNEKSFPVIKTAPVNPSETTEYVLNKNTKKFHYPYCSSVDDMAEKNKLFFSGTRDEVIEKGYVPCKRCKP